MNSEPVVFDSCPVILHSDVVVFDSCPVVFNYLLAEVENLSVKPNRLTVGSDFFTVKERGRECEFRRFGQTREKFSRDGLPLFSDNYLVREIIIGRVFVSRKKIGGTFICFNRCEICNSLLVSNRRELFYKKF